MYLESGGLALARGLRDTPGSLPAEHCCLRGPSGSVLAGWTETLSDVGRGWVSSSKSGTGPLVSPCARHGAHSGNNNGWHWPGTGLVWACRGQAGRGKEASAFSQPQGSLGLSEPARDQPCSSLGMSVKGRDQARSTMEGSPLQLLRSRVCRVNGPGCSSILVIWLLTLPRLLWWLRW